MNIVPTELPEVLIIQPRVFADSRGWFYESFNARTFAEKTGVNDSFVQDNHSCSNRHVLRGLHYQIQQVQGKLVRALVGTIYDVAVDIRRSSPRFGQWVGVELSAENRQQLWVPPGFAHGFLVLSEIAEVQYKTTDYWGPGYERCIVWDDPSLGITWPLDGHEPILSDKDRAGQAFRAAEVFA